MSARNPGKVQAALTENRRVLSELVLEPLREEQYFEVVCLCTPVFSPIRYCQSTRLQFMLL